MFAFNDDDPMAIFWFPEMFLYKLESPTATLLAPSTFDTKDWLPIAVLDEALLFSRAPVPTAVLKLPTELCLNAAVPKDVLFPPPDILIKLFGPTPTLLFVLETVNDSKKELGSRVDRHEKIGKGLLTMETFWCLINDERFAGIPMLLETPVDDPSDYANEIKLLRSLKGSKKPKH